MHVPQLRLEVTGNSSRIVVTREEPRAGFSPVHYDVRTQLVKEAALDVQRALEKLAKTYSSFLENKNPPPDVLQDVKDAGLRLYGRLVHGNSATNLDAMLKGHPVQLFVRFDNLDFHIPWGAIITPLSSEDADIPDLKEFLEARCWATRHRVVAQPYHVEEPSPGPERQPGSAVLAGFDEEIFKRVCKNTKSIGVRGPYFKSDEFTKSWKEMNEEDHFVYLFGHAKATEFQFVERPPDLIETTTFMELLSTDHQGKRGVLLLNGCDSTYSTAPKIPWTEATWTGGFRGMIGVETKINEDVAWSLGKELIDRINSKRACIGDLVADFRHACWPWSLLYGMYCDPDYSLGLPREAAMSASQGNK